MTPPSFVSLASLAVFRSSFFCLFVFFPCFFAHTCVSEWSNDSFVNAPRFSCLALFLWRVIVRPRPRSACPRSVRPVSVAINDAQRNFAGVSVPELEHLNRAHTFCRDLIETVTKKITYSKKTRGSQQESKLTLAEAQALYSTYETEYAFLDVAEAESLQVEIAEATELASRARAVMISSPRDGRSADAMLEELKKMQLILPEIDLLVSFHEGLVWSEQCDKAIANKSTLTTLRSLIAEAERLHLTAPPHVAQKEMAASMLVRAEEWAQRVKAARAARPTIEQVNALLDEGTPLRGGVSPSLVS